MTPTQRPSPQAQDDWSFPDTEEGILAAIKAGADMLWANTILFAQHPLQTSRALDRYANDLLIVGQPPLLVEQYDDKDWVNSMLRRAGRFNLPRGLVVSSTEDESFAKIPLPAVGKPIRGRGSHGVRLCRSREELRDHMKMLLAESPKAMVEEYLSGEEATVAVMPQPWGTPDYYALPVVLRFNHADGVAPYSGTVAVSANSRVISQAEHEADPAFQKISQQCVEVARLLGVTAPIRIDVRRYSSGSDFALFDVNLKPNMTGPGRPGRDSQASLVALSASQLGWSYATLVERMLATATPLEGLRTRHPIDSK